MKLYNGLPAETFGNVPYASEPKELWGSKCVFGGRSCAAEGDNAVSSLSDCATSLLIWGDQPTLTEAKHYYRNCRLMDLPRVTPGDAGPKQISAAGKAFPETPCLVARAAVVFVPDVSARASILN